MAPVEVRSPHEELEDAERGRVEHESPGRPEVDPSLIADQAHGQVEGPAERRFRDAHDLSSGKEGEEGKRRCRGGDCERPAARMRCLDEEIARLGLDGKRIADGERRIGERGEEQSAFPRLAGQPGEEDCNRAPYERERPPREQDAACDRTHDEGNGAEDARQVAVGLEAQESGGEQAVERRDREQPVSGPLVEEEEGGIRGERSACDHEDSGDRLDSSAAPKELPGEADAEVEEPEARCEPEDPPVDALRLSGERRDLHEARCPGEKHELAPSRAERDDRGCRKHERDEARADEAELAVLDEGHERDEDRADQTEAGDGLGGPGERGQRACGRDPGGCHEGPRLGHELVQCRRGEKRCVRTGDARARRRDGRIQGAEPPARPEARAEERG